MSESYDESTTLVGVVAENGVVMATDKQTTAGTRKKQTRKIKKVHPQAVVSSSGLSALGQKFKDSVENEIKIHKFERGRTISLQHAYEKISKISQSPSRMSPMFAGYDREKSYLAEFGILGSRTEYDSFVSVGSGSRTAIGTLESKYKHGMSLRKAEKVSVEAIENSAEHGVATGVGVDVARIDSDGVTIRRNVKEL